MGKTADAGFHTAFCPCSPAPPLVLAMLLLNPETRGTKTGKDRKGLPLGHGHSLALIPSDIGRCPNAYSPSN